LQSVCQLAVWQLLQLGPPVLPPVSETPWQPAVAQVDDPCLSKS